MPDPRWPAAPGPADPFAPGAAPRWGRFTRTPDGMALQAAPAPAGLPRVLGSAPPAAGALRPRRNAANGSVYVDDRTRLTRLGQPGRRVPVRGEIAAGHYDVTVAYHDYLDYEHGVEVDPALVPEGCGAFALRVRGTSMTHVGIEPGDIVVVKPQDRADNGDFVVAVLTDSADPEGYVTLKRFYQKKDHVYLQSATAAQEPIRLYPRGRGADRDRVQVQGRVIAVLKDR